MAEFCIECFLKQNPEFTKEDLVIIKDPDLCEGCGKIVDKVVLSIKNASLHKIKNVR